MADPRLFNKVWRMANLYKIVNKDGALVKFKKNRAQLHFEANRHTRNIILKSRQLGFTTDESIDMLDDALFTKNFSCLFIAHKKHEAESIFDKKVKIAWNQFPLKHLYKPKTDRANEFTFEFGDDTQSTYSVDVSGRSGTFRRVHVSEFAKLSKDYPKKAKEVITGTFPAVPIGGRIDIESTAEGELGDFAEMFWIAWERDRPPYPTEFKAHFYNFTWDDDELAKIDIIPVEHMDKSEEFARIQKLHNLTDREISYYFLKWLELKKDWDMLHQEYPITPEEAFISSGSKFFNQDILIKQVIKDGEVVGHWVIYEPYKPNYSYSGGADPAEGGGRDNAAAHILNVTKGTIAAEFYDNRTEPDMFGHELNKMGKNYGYCLWVVERNGPGGMTLKTLRDLDYPNIYFEMVTDEAYDKPKKKLGFNTNSRTKPILLAELNTALNEEALTVCSARTRRQLSTYIRDDIYENSTRDDYIGHWDGVMSIALAWAGRTLAYAVGEDPEHGEEDDGNDPLDKYKIW